MPKGGSVLAAPAPFKGASGDHPEKEMQSMIRDLMQKGKGILADDGSLSAIAKRFKAMGVESSEETRRACRSVVLSA